MNFPLFLQGGPAIDIPVAPMQYPMLNFMPAIQVLKSNQKQPASSSSAKAKDDDVNVEGVKGHVEQWQDLYDAAKTKASKILAYLGEDAVHDPNYKKAISEINQLESPGVKNTLKEYKSNLERYKANTKDKGTLFNLEEGFKTGVFSTFNYWSNYLDQSQTEDIGRTDETAKPWLKNFNFNPTAFSIDDAITQIKENNKTGTSESNYKTSRNNIEEFAKGSMAGLLKVHNSNTNSYRSNINKFGERNMVEGQVVTEKGPDGKPLPVDRGQLDYALEENQRKAFQAFNLADKINQGLFQDFAARTAANIPSTDREMSNEQHAFRRRMDLGLTEEQKRVLDQTLDGYYYKPGTIRDGVDVSGQLDEETMMNDYKNHANGILASEYNVAIQEFKSEIDDSDWTFYNQNDEQTKDWYAKQEATIFAAGAQQSQTTIAATEDQGYTEDDLLKLIGGDGNKSLLGSLVENMQNILSGTTSQGLVDIATQSNEASPFEIIINSDGRKSFIPKDPKDWDTQAMREKLIADTKNKNPKWTDADIEKDVDAKMIKVTQLHNNATKQRYSKSGMGEGRLETTQIEWTPQQASAEFIEVLQRSFFGKNAQGEVLGKKASEALKHIDVQFGETVAEGGGLFGDIRIASMTNDLKLKAVSLAKNCGVIATKDIVIGGKTVRKGSFIHMSTLDGLSTEKINELTKSGSINAGSGYWIQQGNMWIDGQKPDRSQVFQMGANSKSVLDAINIDVENNPQGVTDASGQYYSTVVFKDSKDKVIKQLTGKNYKAEVPQYAISTEGNEAYNAAQSAYSKSFVQEESQGIYQYQDEMERKMGRRGQGKQSFDIELYADNLKLKGKNREDFIRDSKGKTRSAIINLGGKYYGQQAGKGNYDWNTKPVMRDMPIIVNGEPTQDFKNTVGWKERTTTEGYLWDEYEVEFHADVNVTGALYNGSKVTRAATVEGQKVYQQSNKTQPVKKENKLELPNINARK